MKTRAGLETDEPVPVLEMAPRADRGHPGGADANDAMDKHRPSQGSGEFIEKDASTGRGSQHSRESRPEGEDIEGKDGALNRAGDERGWNASQQPRDAHGRFIAEKDKNGAQSAAAGRGAERDTRSDGR